MATDTLPTEEEFLRVRRFECENVFGHSLEIILDDKGEPRGIKCDHCGRQWPVFSPRSQKRRGAR